MSDVAPSVLVPEVEVVPDQATEVPELPVPQPGLGLGVPSAVRLVEVVVEPVDQVSRGLGF